MRFIEQTENQLTLRFNYLGWILLPGAALVLGGLLAFARGEFHSLTCQRIPPQQGTCQLTTSKLFRQKNRKIPLSQIQHAQVRLKPDSNNYEYYYLILVTQTGEIPFKDSPTIFSSERIKRILEKKAGAINLFLEDTRQDYLLVNQDERSGLYLMGLLLISLAIFLFFSADIALVYTFDRHRQIIIREHQYLGRRQVIEIGFPEITQVELSEKRDGDGYPQYQAELQLKSGESWRLSPWFMKGKSHNQLIATSVVQFLNL